MRLSMVVDGEARDALRREGRLRGDPARVSFEGWRPAYGWMAERMADRLPRPADGGAHWPLWAWRARRPCFVEDEGPGLWELELEVPDGLVLLSDFEAWHYVLNGWYLPDLRAADGGEAEGEAFDAELEAAGVEWADRPWPEPFLSRARASWDRAFDLRPGPGNAVQAVFSELSESQVLSERPTGRCAAPGPERPCPGHEEKPT